jgi:hypothetical protein
MILVRFCDSQKIKQGELPPQPVGQQRSLEQRLAIEKMDSTYFIIFERSAY